MNPYFLLEDISGKEKTPIENAKFSPIVISLATSDEINTETDVKQFVSQYIDAIRIEDINTAIAALKKFFLDLNLLKQALVEAVVKYIGVKSLAFTEYVFSLVTSKDNFELTGIMCLLLTKKIISTANKETTYENYLVDELSLAKKLAKSEKTKFAKKESDAMYVKDIIDETISLKKELADDMIKSFVDSKLYQALKFADVKYHAFPMQIYSMVTRNEITRKELDEMREEYIELPKASNADKLLGLSLEKGVY